MWPAYNNRKRSPQLKPSSGKTGVLMLGVPASVSVVLHVRPYSLYRYVVLIPEPSTVRQYIHPLSGGYQIPMAPFPYVIRTEIFSLLNI